VRTRAARSRESQARPQQNFEAYAHELEKKLEARWRAGQLLAMMLPAGRPPPKQPKRDMAYRPFTSVTEMGLYRGGDDQWTEHLMARRLAQSKPPTLRSIVRRVASSLRQ
jgi:hypothetical protein